MSKNFLQKNDSAIEKQNFVVQRKHFILFCKSKPNTKTYQSWPGSWYRGQLDDETVQFDHTRWAGHKLVSGYPAEVPWALDPIFPSLLLDRINICHYKHCRITNIYDLYCLLWMKCLKRYRDHNWTHKIIKQGKFLVGIVPDIQIIWYPV